ncbi:MAG: MFS transporter [Sphingobium sp.]
MQSRSGRYLFPAAILLVGINLRPTMAAIGPVLDQIQYDTGLSDIDASLLTALPVVLMGICLFATGRLQALFGMRTGIVAGMALIVASDALRWHWSDATMLLATAMLGGIGIAMVQSLMPIMIRRNGGVRAASLMGVYSTAIMAGALISGMASPWFARLAGWPVALGIWALPALVGGLFWWMAGPHTKEIRGYRNYRGIASQPRAWGVLAFFGLGTGAYTLVLAWLPPFYTQRGWSAEAAGAMLGVVTMAEVVAGIAVSLWIDRLPDRRPALLAAVGSLLLGLLCLALAPLPLAWPAALLSGLGIGALFPLSLIVAVDHGENAEEAGAIAGFVQGGGYVLAAGLPLIAGLLRQHLDDLAPAWWLMAALCVVLALIAVRLRPGGHISLSF